MTALLQTDYRLNHKQISIFAGLNNNKSGQWA